jgi:glycosyltransferase involved in cell wall biosynthesis
MKLLFVHDIKSLVCGDKVYARSYGPDIWARYLEVFDSIKVCTRCKEATENEVKGVDQLTCPGVTFDNRIGMFAGPDAFFRSNVKKVLSEDIHECDAMICRMDSFMGLMAVEECKRQSKPYIIEVVGCAWDSFWNHGVSGKILAPFMFYLLKRAIRQSKYNIYVTRDFLQHRYPSNGKSTNISNVALDTPLEEVLQTRLAKIAGKQDNVTNLFSVANVGVRYKGMHFVVEALGVLKQRGFTNFVYHMVGEGDQTYIRSEAKKCGVEDIIIFHGPLKHAGVLKTLVDDCDIYMQPSLQEGLPRSVIEAMGCALPCIGSDVAGIPELIDKDFIFDRSKNIPIQIADFLVMMDKDHQLEQAKINFQRSKEYAYPVLRDRRYNFLKTFIEEIKI